MKESLKLVSVPDGLTSTQMDIIHRLEAWDMSFVFEKLTLDGKTWDSQILLEREFKRFMALAGLITLIRLTARDVPSVALEFSLGFMLIPKAIPPRPSAGREETWRGAKPPRPSMRWLGRSLAKAK